MVGVSGRYRGEERKDTHRVLVEEREKKRELLVGLEVYGKKY
jgi:hypothetical protein